MWSAAFGFSAGLSSRRDVRVRPSCCVRMGMETWQYRGLKVVYRVEVPDGSLGASAPALLAVHGFGAHNGHWRKNVPVWGKKYRTYAVDLLGFGGSDKLAPGTGFPDRPEEPLQYTFELWAKLLQQFTEEVVGGPTFIVANSIGCLAALQLAVSNPDLVRGVVNLNPSMRALDVRKRNAIDNFTAPLMMKFLKVPAVGEFFFSTLAKPNVLKQVLQSAYYDRSAITDELITLFREPALDPGALQVFLAFISYDVGPIPEDFFEVLQVPAIVVWGEEDQLEPIAPGRALESYDSVREFIVLPQVGHCPQDERPDLINPLVEDFVDNLLVGVAKTKQPVPS